MKINRFRKICIYIVACIIFMPCVKVYSQQLKVGEELPDGIMKDVINYSKKEIRYSDFKDKIIILDFWSFTCSSCLESFPKLDSLQKMYKNDIQIIMINPEASNATRNLFEKRKKSLFKPGLPLVTNDKYYHNLLSIYGKPAYGWFNSNGKFYGMTSYISKYHIDLFLKKKYVSNTDYIQPEYISNLFDTKYSDNIGYYSYIAHHIMGIQQSGEKNTLSVPGTILELYYIAYDPENKYKFRKPGRFILETNDSTRYVVPTGEDNVKVDWIKKNFYDYSLRLPKERLSDKYEIMKEDLSRYFNIKAKIEKRSISSFVLIRTSNEDKLKTSGKENKMTFLQNFIKLDDSNAPFREMVNHPYSAFSNVLGNLIYQSSYKQPFIDETNFTGNIDIKFKSEIFEHPTIESIIQELHKYDLDLIERNVIMDVLILNDKN